MKSTRSSDMAVSFPFLRCHELGPAAGHQLIGSVRLFSDEFAVLDHASVHRPVSGAPRPLVGAAGVGHDTPVSDQVSDNGTHTAEYRYWSRTLGDRQDHQATPVRGARDTAVDAAAAPKRQSSQSSSLSTGHP